MRGFACRYLFSSDRTKYRMFISRHLAYGVFLPVSGADFIMLYPLVSAPFSCHVRPDILSLVQEFLPDLFNTFSEPG
jgi:hypothetical protein